MPKFEFKQFSIHQSSTVFKVGTDGVLLGSWCEHANPNHILDIGTGTGLIALMCAQRFPAASVVAIDNFKEAADLAQHNVSCSPWSNRVKVVQQAISDYQRDLRFDLITSNPPYFSQSHASPAAFKNQARHEPNIGFLTTLFSRASKLLSTNGSFCLIIPYDRQSQAVGAALPHDLKPARVLTVRGTASSPIKRVLLQFEFNPAQRNEEALIIEEARHKYTQAYKSLTKDFYLAF